MVGNRGFILASGMWFEGDFLINRNQIESLHNASNPTTWKCDTFVIQAYFDFSGSVSGLALEENSFNSFFKLRFRYWLHGLIVITWAWHIQPATHGWNAIVILISSDYFPFCAILTAACFRISNCISSSLLRFLSSISSRCSSVRLSTDLNEPVVLACLTHLSKVKGVSSYSLMRLLRFLPAL